MKGIWQRKSSNVSSQTQLKVFQSVFILTKVAKFGETTESNRHLFSSSPK